MQSWATAVATGIATAIFFTTSAFAQQKQNFPTKPVRVVVGFSPGSQSDIIARLIVPKMADSWGQPVVVDNRAGGGGQIAAAIVARSAPDGYTLLLTSSALAISAASDSKLPYDTLKDFNGVAQIAYTTQALVVSPSLGIKSVKEFIAYAQDRPGKVLYGSAGAGSATHLNAERLRLETGIKIVHVGFKGQPEFLVEIMAGRIHFAIAGLGSALPFIKDGRIVALAVNTPHRTPSLPDVPSINEAMPGYEKDGSHALLAPAGTPRPILQNISREVARALSNPEVKERLTAAGFVPAPSSPEEYDKILRAQIATFSKVLTAAGLRGK